MAIREMKVADLVTDTPTRLRIEAKARADAEIGHYEVPIVDKNGTYFQQAVQGAMAHIYILAHGKRTARIARMKAN